MYLTMAQALVKFLDNQYVSFDGEEIKFVEGVATIFGHGIVVGLGQALDEDPGSLKVFQGKNEQGMAHMATAFAKMNNRRRIIACSSSIGPGAANMITAAATATVNNIPLLLLPADTFATRQPDPVLQQFEQPYSLTVTTNDAYKAVVRYWDRVSRPEQLMSAMINAMRVLTDPNGTGAVCVCLPQDVEGEAYDYPESFLAKRVHVLRRPVPTKGEIDAAVEVISKAKKPLLIVGGGARYSEAGKTIEAFTDRFEIPFAETQAGKTACIASHPLNLGGVGVTGNSAANTIAKDADVIIAVGTRFSDFTTASKSLFRDDVRIVSVNTSPFDAVKLDAVSVIGDAKASLQLLEAELDRIKYRSEYVDEPYDAKAAWDAEMKRLASFHVDDIKTFEPLIGARDKKSLPEFVKMTGSALTQVEVLAKIRELIDRDAVAVGSAGSLPGDMQRMWTSERRNSYNMEYGYSCMGYEIAGALGSKLACPDREVYAFCGDGSFLMLHGELLTSIQEGAKINVLLFDNAGFGCINNLQMSHGIGSLATEFRFRDKKGGLNGAMVPVDYALVAAGYGCRTYTVTTMEELEDAIEDAKKQTVSTLIDIKVLPKTMTDGYGAWWHVGDAQTAKKASVRKAGKETAAMLEKARKY